MRPPDWVRFHPPGGQETDFFLWTALGMVRINTPVSVTGHRRVNKRVGGKNRGHSAPPWTIPNKVITRRSMKYPPPLPCLTCRRPATDPRCQSTTAHSEAHNPSERDPTRTSFKKQILTVIYNESNLILKIQGLRPPLNKKLFLVDCPSGLKSADWNFYLCYFFIIYSVHSSQ